jgi:hypothetical protein
LDGFIFDEDAWPLVYIRFPSGRLSDHGLETYLTRFNGYLRRDGQFVSISDCRGLGIAPNANLRKRITDWLAEDDQVNLGPKNAGHALLFGNTVIRGALTAVFWIASPPAPIKAFGSITDAAPWVRERLMDAHVDLSPAMEDLLANRM